MSAAELAAAAQEQRRDTQAVVDQLGQEVEVVAARERRLKELLQGVRSRLQYHGAQNKVRELA